MADLRSDPSFRAAVEAGRTIIFSYSLNGIPDAEAITNRGAGWNNLQAHANSVVPLAVHLVRARPGLLGNIKSATSLNLNMDGPSADARNSVWDLVRTEMQHLLQTHGADVISEQLSDGSALTASDIAHTYLSVDYGGGQTSGGAANTVLKRTLKLLAHGWIA